MGCFRRYVIVHVKEFAVLSISRIFPMQLFSRFRAIMCVIMLSPEHSQGNIRMPNMEMLYYKAELHKPGQSNAQTARQLNSQQSV